MRTSMRGEPITPLEYSLAILQFSPQTNYEQGYLNNDHQNIRSTNANNIIYLNQLYDAENKEYGKAGLSQDTGNIKQTNYLEDIANMKPGHTYVTVDRDAGTIIKRQKDKDDNLYVEVKRISEKRRKDSDLESKMDYEGNKIVKTDKEGGKDGEYDRKQAEPSIEYVLDKADRKDKKLPIEGKYAEGGYDALSLYSEYEKQDPGQGVKNSNVVEKNANKEFDKNVMHLFKEDGNGAGIMANPLDAGNYGSIVHLVKPVNELSIDYDIENEEKGKMEIVSEDSGQDYNNIIQIDQARKKIEKQEQNNAAMNIVLEGQDLNQAHKIQPLYFPYRSMSKVA